MMGLVLFGIGCFALGGLLGFFVGLAMVAYGIAHNKKGVRDTVERAIAKSKELDRVERTMEAMLAKLKDTK